MENRTTYCPHSWGQSYGPHPIYENTKKKLKIPMVTIKNTFKKINTIAIQYAMSILLHKRRLENHQPLPQNLDPP
jgi:hypothetical protein